MAYCERCDKLGFDKCECGNSNKENKENKMLDRIEGEYYSISKSKLALISERVSRLSSQKITEYEVEDDLINTYWEEGDEHQEWLNNASVDGIANWVWSIYP